MGVRVCDRQNTDSTVFVSLMCVCVSSYAPGADGCWEGRDEQHVLTEMIGPLFM